MDIKGRVALVTGAASGIGKSCAIELLNEGAMVSICDINAEDGEKLAETLSTEYGKDRVSLFNAMSQITRNSRNHFKRRSRHLVTSISLLITLVS